MGGLPCACSGRQPTTQGARGQPEVYQFMRSSPPAPVPIIMPPNTMEMKTTSRQRCVGRVAGVGWGPGVAVWW
jgi:hypothetical protein